MYVISGGLSIMLEGAHQNSRVHVSLFCLRTVGPVSVSMNTVVRSTTNEDVNQGL